MQFHSTLTNLARVADDANGTFYTVSGIVHTLLLNMVISNAPCTGCLFTTVSGVSVEGTCIQKIPRQQSSDGA